MGVNSLPKTVTRQRRGYDLNPGATAPESSTLTTRLPGHPHTTDDRESIRTFPFPPVSMQSIPIPSRFHSSQV